MRVRLTDVYVEWINSLRDKTARARIQVRVDRLVHGNPGDHRNLTGGIAELRIDVCLDTVSIARSAATS